MGHGEKSVYLIARFMKLEDEEALAIRWPHGRGTTRRARREPWLERESCTASCTSARGGYAGHAYRGGWYGMKGRRGALGPVSRHSMSNNRGHDFEGGHPSGVPSVREPGPGEGGEDAGTVPVLEKREGGIFVGRFTAHAQPDFQGTLDGGRSIIFEAKYTPQTP